MLAVVQTPAFMDALDQNNPEWAKRVQGTLIEMASHETFTLSAAEVCGLFSLLGNPLLGDTQEAAKRRAAYTKVANAFLCVGVPCGDGAAALGWWQLFAFRFDFSRFYHVPVQEPIQPDRA